MMINGNKNSFLRRIGSGFVEYERLKRLYKRTEKELKRMKERIEERKTQKE